MTSMWNRSKRFLREEDGPTAVEYAVMMALIVAVCLGAVRALALATGASFSASANAMSGL